MTSRVWPASSSFLNAVEQLGDVVEVQPGRRLVEDVEQRARRCATTGARRS